MRSEPIFSSEELQANQVRLSKLVSLIKSGDAILMAGAGSSGSLFPAWGKFIEELENEAKQKNKEFNEGKDDFLVFADKVKECLGEDEYYALIYRTFQPGERTHEQFHEVLCGLPFKAITTTNYDFVLESALNVVTPYPNNSLHFEGTTKPKIHQFLLSLNHNNNIPKRIAHLHGVCDEPDSIILGGKEYMSKYGFSLSSGDSTLYDEIKNGSITKEKFHELLFQYGYEWPIRRKLLWSLLATRRIFFVGFSLKDPYFIKMLDFVKSDLSTYHAETHFLLLRITPAVAEESKIFSRDLKAKYGIVTVFYEEGDEIYTGLGNFVTELASMVGVSDIISLLPKNKESEMDVGDEQLTDELFSLSNKQIRNEN